jgi:hypothetical protein
LKTLTMVVKHGCDTFHDSYDREVEKRLMFITLRKRKSS